MKKLITVVAASVCAVSFSATAFAEAPATDNKANAEAMEKEETDWFSAGFDADLFSAYVFRNAIFNDELVIQPCVWVDLTLFDFLTVGGNVWQNWNLTDRWKQDGIPQEMNESDYDVHVGANIWESDDEEYSLYLQLAHDWFTYRYDLESDYEIQLRMEFNNPFVGVYGQYSHCYAPSSACLFEVGLKQDWTVGEIVESENDYLNRLTVGFDWNMSFGSGRFFSKYLWGPVQGAYDPATGEYGEENIENGIGGTTIKGMLGYRVCDHFTIGALLAFTSALSSSVRDSVEYMGHGESYKDLVWGGLQVKLDF